VNAAIPLAPGRGEGAPLLLAEPLSFWGGLDCTTGVVTDPRHPQCGALVAGRVLLMPAGRGSSSGSASLAEAIRLGVAPSAILLLKRDAIVIVGVLAAAELYGISCPVALVETRNWEELAAADRLEVRVEAERAIIAPASRTRTVETSHRI
jgi:predicted aconitase with swiveling domain